MGFGFEETMSGTWTKDGVTRPFSFTVQVRSGPIGAWRKKQQVADMEGTVDAEGLATRQPLRGTLRIQPVLGRVIRYEFAFTGDDGKPYTFAGQKDIRWLSPLRTWTELPGDVRDADGNLVGTAMTRFDLKKDGLTFMRSWKPA
ncbi:MAG: hypothetical protein K8M05_37820 [Deltaproteobacteria bacterium]|nr:hypothetical protein [Kofleriaceae bacterium]